MKLAIILMLVSEREAAVLDVQFNVFCALLLFRAVNAKKITF